MRLLVTRVGHQELNHRGARLAEDIVTLGSACRRVRVSLLEGERSPTLPHAPPRLPTTAHDSPLSSPLPTAPHHPSPLLTTPHHSSPLFTPHHPLPIHAHPSSPAASHPYVAAHSSPSFRIIVPHHHIRYHYSAQHSAPSFRTIVPPIRWAWDLAGWQLACNHRYLSLTESYQSYLRSTSR